MILRRALGVLLGIVIGLFPFLNYITCITYSFIKRKFIVGSFLSVVFITQVVLLFYVGEPSKKTVSAINTLSQEMQAGLTNSAFSATDLKTSADFERSLRIQLDDAENRAAAKHSDTKDLLAETVKSAMSADQQTSFTGYTQKVFELYKEQSEMRNPSDSLSLSNFSVSAKKELNILTRDFIKDYLTKETVDRKIGFLFLFPFVFLLIFSVYLFRNVFLETQQNSNRSENDNGTQNNGRTQNDNFQEHAFFNWNNGTDSYTRTSSQSSERPISQEEINSILNNAMGRAEASASPAGTFKINIENQDRIAELAGVGAIQAMNIVNDRRDNGYFKNMDDFRRRISLSERVHNGLAEQLDFSMPEERRGGKGRVVEF